MLTTDMDLLISTANSVRQLADGTVVCEGHGPDGATVMVVLRDGAMDMKFSLQGVEWQMTLSKIDDGVEVKHNAVQHRPVSVQHDGARKPREVVLCPMCHHARHWKGKDSIRECAWRQWAIATGRMELDAAPKDNGPESTPEYEVEFEAWVKAHPKGITGDGFGSVPQERLLRQRARERARSQQ